MLNLFHAGNIIHDPLMEIFDIIAHKQKVSIYDNNRQAFSYSVGGVPTNAPETKKSGKLSFSGFLGTSKKCYERPECKADGVQKPESRKRSG